MLTRHRDKPKPEPSKTEPEQVENSGTKPSNGQAKDAREQAEKENVEESTKERADNAKPNGDANGDQAEDDTSKVDDTGAVQPKDEAMTDAPQAGDKEDGASSLKRDGSAVEAGGRDVDVSSNILEKGIIYFFFRARVNVDEPQDTNDIARSYMVLRPLPHNAKLGEGPIGDQGNNRLLAIPKKVLPISGKDRFMCFVEKAKTSFQELKDDFMSASDYATKTAGTSHSPPVTPVAEGIYAITTTGRESHLAYMLTIPSELGEVKRDIGLREVGSFVTSIKNPEQKGPANASLGKAPEYPKE